MTFLVVTPPEVEAEIRAIDAWWRENRPASPGLFAEELAGGLEILRGTPHVGRRYRHRDVPNVRRLLLRATRYHIYYTVHGNAVCVLAVWSAWRGSGPDLTDLF
jgi:plasmid stabilization system protein ParE